VAARDADLLEAARAGKPLAYGGRPPGTELAERMLAPVTDWLRRDAAGLPGLRGLDLDAVLGAAEHEWFELGGLLHHAEVHRARGERRGAVVYVHGLGDHARRSTALGGALADAGWDAVLVDRRGHGLSEGVRGDAALADDFALARRALADARERFGGPVVLVGDSLGGIMSWYLLADGVEADAVVCHCINHPRADHDPTMRFKRPVMRAVGRIAPRLRIPVTQIADYSQVALEPVTGRYFEERIDPLFNFSVTARAAVGYLEFSPRRPWEEVELPVLVMIGDEDRMVTRAHVERCLALGKPPRTTLMALPGMGHQIYLDHLADALPPMLEWLDGAVSASRPPAA